MWIFSIKRKYHRALDDATLQTLARKNFSEETLKKVSWVKNMFQHWREFRNSSEDLQNIECDLDDVKSINEESLKFVLCRFLTKVKKLDGSDFPAKMMYDILICMQFHLETLGLAFKFLSDDKFQEVRFTL